MNAKDMEYKFLEFRIVYHEVSSWLNVILLFVLYFLNFKVWFWALFSLFILTEILVGIELAKRIKKLELKV